MKAAVNRGSGATLWVSSLVCDFFVELVFPVLVHLMWYFMWLPLPLTVISVEVVTE